MSTAAIRRCIQCGYRCEHWQRFCRQCWRWRMALWHLSRGARARRVAMSTRRSCLSDAELDETAANAQRVLDARGVALPSLNGISTIEVAPKIALVEGVLYPGAWLVGRPTEDR